MSSALGDFVPLTPLTQNPHYIIFPPLDKLKGLVLYCTTVQVIDVKNVDPKNKNR